MGRNESKKGDFILRYEDGLEVSYSLKVYVKGYASIQVRSGTYNSWILSIILKEYALPSVGMYSNPIPEDEWKELTKGMKYSIRKYKSKFDGGKSLAIRDIVLKYLGLNSAIDLLHALDKVKEDSIARFRDDLHTRNYFNDGVEEAWEDQCKVAGNAGASLICNYLKNKNVDIQFKDKVVVVQILGTWCPNCLDETQFFLSYIEENPNKNLAFVALSVEAAKTEEKAMNRIKNMIDKFIPKGLLDVNQ